MPSSSNLPGGGLLTDISYKLDHNSKTFLGCGLVCIRNAVTNLAITVVGLGGGIGSSEIGLVRGTPITPLSLSTVILPKRLRFEQELANG